jgi:predicted nuclease with TOPRIM domain
MTTLPTIVMDQASDVIRGLQATVARLQGELESARQTIEELRGENNRLAAKARRQSGALRRERKAATWQQ